MLLTFPSLHRVSRAVYAHNFLLFSTQYLMTADASITGQSCTLLTDGRTQFGTVSPCESCVRSSDRCDSLRRNAKQGRNVALFACLNSISVFVSNVCLNFYLSAPCSHFFCRRRCVLLRLRGQHGTGHQHCCDDSERRDQLVRRHQCHLPRSVLPQKLALQASLCICLAEACIVCSRWFRVVFDARSTAAQL